MLAEMERDVEEGLVDPGDVGHELVLHFGVEHYYHIAVLHYLLNERLEIFDIGFLLQIDLPL